MNPAVSVYLDLLRFVAATMVFLSHAAYPRLGGEWLGAWGGFGHDAVVIFFVLSGYVIGYVSRHRHAGPSDYAISRLARLWSVVLPALILGLIVDNIGSQLDPSLYDGWWYSSDRPVYRFTVHLFFVAELWHTSVRAFGNGPFWSVSYEAWYYIFFAAWFYTRGRWTWVATILVAGIMGPKILVLMPIWWMGYLALRLNERGRQGPLLSWVLFIGSMVAYYFHRELNVTPLAMEWVQEVFGRGLASALSAANRFPADTLLGLLVALNFIGFYGISESLGRHIVSIGRPIRWLAGFTFSIYLFHYPLLQFFNAWTHKSKLSIALVGVSIVLLGLVTEQKKQPYVRGLKWIRGRFTRGAEDLGQAARP